MPYTHIFGAFTSNLESIVTQGGYIFLLVTTLLEGLPLIGMLIPGHVSIIIAGFLSKIGILNIYWVAAISIFGAVAGDFIGFYLGRKYGMSFIDRLRPYFFVTQEHIDKAHRLLDKHTGKAMIIGRFSPVTRPLMPFLVGTSKTPIKKFWIFNFIGAISWTIASVAVGYIFGAGYGVATELLGKFTIFAVIAAIIIIWGYHFINARFQIFKKYELIVLILNVIALYVLSRTIQDAWSPHSFMANFDVCVNLFMEQINQAHLWLRAISLWISNVGGTMVMTILGLITTLFLVVRRRFRSAAIMFFAIGSTGLILGILKTFFMRVRPENALITIVNDPSFPSGHSAMAAAFFLIVGYLLVRKIRPIVWRELMIVGCVLAGLAIGLSRITLNVHWVSDVIAGWSLGIFFATASILLVRYLGVLLLPNEIMNNQDKK